MNQTLTKVINGKIKLLKNQVDNISDGGCLQSLQIRLEEIRKDINNFILLIDETNTGRN